MPSKAELNFYLLSLRRGRQAGSEYPNYNHIIGTFIKYYKISQLIHTQIIAN